MYNDYADDVTIDQEDEDNVNKFALLLVGILACNQQTITCAQDEEATYQIAENPARHVLRCEWLLRAVRVAIFAGVFLGPLILTRYFGEHNNLDPQRPFTCADMYHRYSDGHREFANMCAHTQEPFRKTKYEFLPKGLKERCLRPHYPDAPTWDLPGEIESLSFAREPVPYTNFVIICRYSPQ